MNDPQTFNNDDRVTIYAFQKRIFGRSALDEMVPPPELYSFRLQTPMSNFTAVIPMKCSLCRRYYLLERKLRGSDRLLRFDGCITPIYFSTPRNHCVVFRSWPMLTSNVRERSAKNATIRESTMSYLSIL